RKTIVVIACFCIAPTLLLVGAALAGTQSQRAKPVQISVALTAKQEVPRPKGVPGKATGTFRATLTGTTLQWTLTFKGLSGKATAAHIHQAARGQSGPVIVALCGPCTSPASGNSTLSDATAKLIRSGGTYVNVHTKKNANGEIRAQVTAKR